MNSFDEIELDEVDEIFTTEETEEQRKERFKIKDLSSLNWALRKLSALGKNHAEEFELSAIEIARIRAWFEKQDAAYQNSRSFLEGLIKEYAEEQRAIDPKWRQKCPYGLVSFRKQKKFDYGDEEKLVQHLTDHGMGGYVKVVKTPMKAELKKALTITKDGRVIFTSTGELLPNVSAEEVEDVTIRLEG